MYVFEIHFFYIRCCYLSILFMAFKGKKNNDFINVFHTFSLFIKKKLARTTQRWVMVNS